MECSVGTKKSILSCMEFLIKMEKQYVAYFLVLYSYCQCPNFQCVVVFLIIIQWYSWDNLSYFTAHTAAWFFYSLVWSSMLYLNLYSVFDVCILFIFSFFFNFTQLQGYIPLKISNWWLVISLQPWSLFSLCVNAFEASATILWLYSFSLHHYPGITVSTTQKSAVSLSINYRAISKVM